MIGNEGSIPSGEVESLYYPQKQFAGNEHQFWNVSNVKWITTLRHPYSRTLSHYHHIIQIKDWHNLTLDTFLTQVHARRVFKLYSQSNDALALWYRIL